LDITAIAAIRALDGLQMRQTVTANNIANANSEGFVASGVNFESALRSALVTGDVHSVQTSPIVQFAQDSINGLTGGGVRVDQEVASLSETTMNYQLLVTMLDRKLSTAKLAFNDGRNA
jgi:flagellar basal-body rod protein FlgB